MKHLTGSTGGPIERRHVLPGQSRQDFFARSESSGKAA
jgi:hypothetical protein